MSTPLKLPDSTDAIRLYQSGLSLNETADRLGVGWHVIYSALVRAGVPRRDNSGPCPKRRLAVPNAPEISPRYQSGDSEKALSLEFGISRPTLKRMLVEHGIEHRGGSESMYIRMANTTPEERLALTAAAHAAVRGVPHTPEVQANHAIGRARTMSHAVLVEYDLAGWLKDACLDVGQQTPVGPYNLDISVNSPPIAVEIFGGNWHAFGRHAARHAQKVKYLLDLGWSVVIIWIDGRRYPLRPAVRDYIVAFADELRAHPTARCEYRVIRGDGQDAPIRRTYLNDTATIERLGGSR